MHDIVIRGGTIVDGTGAPAFMGDVAIDGDRIVQVGGKAGPGRREVKAEGRLVTPGWVDVHTHYDGQATWDPVLAPSSWHGATTIVFGNCGVGFAPVRAQHQTALIEMMEGVEDIPGITLTEGLKWDWESFPEYLDALARLPRTIDIAAQVAHHPLRVYAMGERAINRELATAEDIELMARLTEEALKAGAVGFTTSRTDQHKTLAGDLVPGRYAEHEELIAIGRAMGRAGSRHVRLPVRLRGRGDRVEVDPPGRQGQRPAGLVPADRSQLRPAALAPPDGRCARRAGRQPAALRPGRGTPGGPDARASTPRSIPSACARPMPRWPSCRRPRCWRSCARPSCAA